MPTNLCADARNAIEARRFAGWTGLPAGCGPDALFGVPLDDTWGQLPLGASFEPTRSRLLELPGFYRPIVRVRDGAVVMFEAGMPELADDLPALLASLGTPDEVSDFVFRDVTMAGGEHVFARRGVTLFVNPENQRVLHLALYSPTTVAAYRDHLRLDLSARRR
jgi:hypothetical protein